MRRKNTIFTSNFDLNMRRSHCGRQVVLIGQINPPLTVIAGLTRNLLSIRNRSLRLGDGGCSSAMTVKVEVRRVHQPSAMTPLVYGWTLWEALQRKSPSDSSNGLFQIRLNLYYLPFFIGFLLVAACLAVALLTAAFWTDAVFLLPTAFLA